MDSDEIELDYWDLAEKFKDWAGGAYFTRMGKDQYGEPFFFENSTQQAFGNFCAGYKKAIESDDPRGRSE